MSPPCSLHDHAPNPPTRSSAAAANCALTQPSSRSLRTRSLAIGGGQGLHPSTPPGLSTVLLETVEAAHRRVPVDDVGRREVAGWSGRRGFARRSGLAGSGSTARRGSVARGRPGRSCRGRRTPRRCARRTALLVGSAGMWPTHPPGAVTAAERARRAHRRGLSRLHITPRRLFSCAERIVAARPSRGRCLQLDLLRCRSSKEQSRRRSPSHQPIVYLTDVEHAVVSTAIGPGNSCHAVRCHACHGGRRTASCPDHGRYTKIRRQSAIRWLPPTLQHTLPLPLVVSRPDGGRVPWRHGERSSRRGFRPPESSTDYSTPSPTSPTKPTARWV